MFFDESFFSLPEHKVPMVSFCDRPMSGVSHPSCVVRRPSSVIHIFFNPFPNKPWFLRVCSTSHLKTLWEKEKLLVMTNFSFSHSVFYPFGELFLPFSSNLKLSSAKSFSLEESKMCSLGKG